MPHQVATVLLLFTLSGPVKASSYLVRKNLLICYILATYICWIKEYNESIEIIALIPLTHSLHFFAAYAWSCRSHHGYCLEVRSTKVKFEASAFTIGFFRRNIYL